MFQYRGLISLAGWHFLVAPRGIWADSPRGAPSGRTLQAIAPAASAAVGGCE